MVYAALDFNNPADTETVPSLGFDGSSTAWVRPELIADSRTLLPVSLVAMDKVSDTCRLNWVSSP
ncbi:hypothetical protein D3C73_1601110 [compost metagenome]